MINRIFSNDPKLNHLVDFANKPGFTDLMHYTLFRNAHLVKYGKRSGYIKYPKSLKPPVEIKMKMDHPTDHLLSKSHPSVTNFGVV